MGTIGDGRSSLHARQRSFSHGHMCSQWEMLVLFRALTARIPTTSAYVTCTAGCLALKVPVDGSDVACDTAGGLMKGAFAV